VQIFIEPLRQTKIITDRDIAIIFSNLETIWNMNEQVLANLEKRLKSADNVNGIQAVGDIFQQMGDYFKMYQVYCSNQGASLEAISQLKRTNNSFKQFLERCSIDPRCRSLPLSSFLIKPVQRICKYPLLFKELVRNTPKTHADHQKLIDVKAKIEQIVVHVNEGQRSYEAQQRILVIQNSVEDLSDLVAPARVLSREGTLGIQLGVPFHLQGERVEHHVHLFNDLILFTKKKEITLLSAKKYNLVAKLPIEDVHIVLFQGQDPSGVEDTFQIESGGKIYTLSAFEEGQTVSWFESIKKLFKIFNN